MKSRKLIERVVRIASAPAANASSVAQAGSREDVQRAQTHERASRAMRPPSTPSSTHRRTLGSAAERVVRSWLEARGLRVLAANVRVNYLEVDLLVQDQRTLVVVEVRTRSPGSWTSAFGSVDGWKRTRLRRAAERLWRRDFRYRPEFDHIRFDVASVTWINGKPNVVYVKAAF